MLSNNQPSVIVATIDASGSMYLRVDEEETSKQAASIVPALRRYNYVGRSNWCSADPLFMGSMDYLYVFNRVLTADEIDSIVN